MGVRELKRGVVKMEDTDIIRMFLERNEDAIIHTSEKYNNYCLKIALNILQNRLDADECVNDIYLKLWNSIPPNIPNSLPSFVAKLTRNHAIDIYRNKHTQQHMESEYSVSLDELAECIPDGTDFEESDLKDLLNRFLREQKADARKIFIRRYFYCDEVEQISHFFGISQSKVKTTLFRTRQKLKEYLRKENYTI